MNNQTSEGLPIIMESTLKSFMDEGITTLDNIDDLGICVLDRMRQLIENNPIIAIMIVGSATNIQIAIDSGDSENAALFISYVMTDIYEILKTQAELNQIREMVNE